MNLVIDAGNTRLSFGFFENGKLKTVKNIEYSKNISQEEINSLIELNTDEFSIQCCTISSVADEINNILCDAIINVLKIKPVIINTGMRLGIKILSDTPIKTGTDRIANVVAASKLYKNRPVIVVDCGSATTFDIINEDGNFIGGLILPGLSMQLKSLALNTSKLPMLNLNMMDNVSKVINIESDKAILSGVVYSHAQAIQGLIKSCEKELGKKPFVVGTGGDAEFISEYMDTKFDDVNPSLTLEGINIIYELNK